MRGSTSGVPRRINVDVVRCFPPELCARLKRIHPQRSRRRARRATSASVRRRRTRLWLSCPGRPRPSSSGEREFVYSSQAARLRRGFCNRSSCCTRQPFEAVPACHRPPARHRRGSEPRQFHRITVRARLCHCGSHVVTYLLSVVRDGCISCRRTCSLHDRTWSRPQRGPPPRRRSLRSRGRGRGATAQPSLDLRAN